MSIAPHATDALAASSALCLKTGLENEATAGTVSFSTARIPHPFHVVLLRLRLLPWALTAPDDSWIAGHGLRTRSLQIRKPQHAAEPDRQAGTLGPVLLRRRRRTHRKYPQHPINRAWQENIHHQRGACLFCRDAFVPPPNRDHNTIKRVVLVGFQAVLTGNGSKGKTESNFKPTGIEKIPGSTQVTQTYSFTEIPDEFRLESDSTHFTNIRRISLV